VYQNFVSSVPRSLILLLLLSCITYAVSAQEGDFVPKTSVEYAFGQELRFFINARNAADIEKITLSLRPERSNNLYVMDVPFEPGETISATHSIDVSDLNLEPYSHVFYFWELQSSDGIHKTPEEGFDYEDDRFDWQQMTQNGVTAHWTGSGPFFGQDVLTVVNEALARLATLLPLEQISPFGVYVYPSSADLQAGLRLAEVGGEDTSHPELGVILVTAVNPQSAIADLGQSLPYELAQLLLYRTAGERYENLPWWLTEGLAINVQAKPHPRHTQLLDDAIKSAKTIPVWQLCQKTVRIGDRALLASAQSNSLVSFILQRYGDQALADLISTYGLGDDCETGMGRVIGISLDELEKAWLKAQQPSSALSQFFTDSGLWLLLLLAGSALMVLIIWQSWHGKKPE